MAPLDTVTTNTVEDNANRVAIVHTPNDLIQNIVCVLEASLVSPLEGLVVSSPISQWV